MATAELSTPWPSMSQAERADAEHAWRENQQRSADETARLEILRGPMTADGRPIIVPRPDLAPEQLAVVHQAQRVAERLLTVEQLRQLPKPEWLIEGWLPLDSLAVLYGRPSAGKTFVAADWGMSVASGAWWFGHRVHQGLVFYVVAEGASGFGLRQSAWSAGRRIDDVGPIWFDPFATNLLDSNAASALELVLWQFQPKPVLVVIDTLARAMVGGDENSAKDIGRVIEAADRIRVNTGACVLLLHHVTKAEGVLRGSSALEGAVNTAIECKGGEGSLRLSIEKQKDAADGANLPLYLTSVDLGIDAHGKPVTSCYLTARPGPGAEFGLAGKRQDVLEALRRVDDGDGVTTTVWSETAAGLSVSKTAFYEAKKDLLVRNLVRKIGEGRGARFTLSAPIDKADDACAAF